MSVEDISTAERPETLISSLRSRGYSARTDNSGGILIPQEQMPLGSVDLVREVQRAGYRMDRIEETEDGEIVSRYVPSEVGR